MDLSQAEARVQNLELVSKEIMLYLAAEHIDLTSSEVVVVLGMAMGGVIATSALPGFDLEAFLLVAAEAFKNQVRAGVLARTSRGSGGES